MQKVKKAVVLLAGYGTRCLPFTKSLPKAMIPILNKPAIHYIVEEIENAGIEEVIFVLPKDCNGRIVKDYFSPNKTYEKFLAGRNKAKELDFLKNIKTKLKTIYVYTGKANGSGGAILSAKKHLKNQPFLVLNGDDLFLDDGNTLKLLIENYEKQGKTALTVKQVPDNLRGLYGIIEGKKKDGFYEVERMVEKPKGNEISGNLASIGRYVASEEMIDILQNHTPVINGELSFSEGLVKLASMGRLNAVETQGERFDAGNTLEIVKANVHLALKNAQFKENLTNFLTEELK
jgi:UTP--glucose-1-phosphate uridylyltransferase